MRELRLEEELVEYQLGVMYIQVFIMLFCIFSEGLKYFTIKSMRLKVVHIILNHCDRVSNIASISYMMIFTILITDAIKW